MLDNNILIRHFRDFTIAAGLLLTYSIIQYQVGLSPPFAAYWSDAFWTLAAFITAWRSYLAARRATLPQDIIAWYFFSGASLSWALGMVAWDYYEIISGISVPFPSAADIGFMGFPVFFVIGALFYGTANTVRKISLKHMLDIGIVTTAVIIITALALHQPLRETSETVFYIAVTLSYPILYGAASLLGLSWLWSYTSKRRQRTFALMIIGLLFHTGVNIEYAASLLLRDYQAGLPLDIFWLIGFAFLYLGAAESDTAAIKDETQPTSDADAALEQTSEAVVPGLALASILAAGYFYSGQDIHTELHNFLFVLGGIFVALLIAREFWIFTQHKKIYASLVDSQLQTKTSEQNLRSILDTMSETFYRTDVEGNLVNLSKSVFSLLGYHPDEAIGTPIMNYYATPEKRVEFLENLAASGGIAVDYEMDMRHKNGTIVWVSTNAHFYYDEAGNIAGVEGTTRNITHRKKAEEALIKANNTLEERVEERTLQLQQEINERKQIEVSLQKALSEARVASRAKTDLMANMSHELRTPLNAIIGFSSSIMEGTFGPVSNKKHMEYLDDIKHSGQHLLELINDILDVSAIEENALVLHEESVSPLQIIESTTRLAKPRAEQRKITISIDPKVDKIYVDNRRLKQILINLVGNAVKFTPENGTISIATKLHPDGTFSLSVQDNGVGMTADELDIAVSKFGQVDSGLNRKHEGTGLGLPLTKGLVELHGGTFLIESTKSIGTTVTVTLPKERVTSTA